MPIFAVSGAVSHIQTCMADASPSPSAVAWSAGGGGLSDDQAALDLRHCWGSH